MNKEKEIEEMGKAMCEKFRSDHCGNDCECANEFIAEKLINAGYGNVKQAVEEFAEKVKPIIGELVELMFNDYESHCKITNCEKDDGISCGCNICIEENEKLWKSKIDNLITELYGVDE